MTAATGVNRMEIVQPAPPASVAPAHVSDKIANPRPAKLVEIGPTGTLAVFTTTAGHSDDSDACLTPAIMLRLSPPSVTIRIDGGSPLDMSRRVNRIVFPFCDQAGRERCSAQSP